MNNIIERAIERASREYKVTILLDESAAAHFSELDVPNDVKMSLKKTSCGVYVELSGNAESVMALEVDLYDIISKTYIYSAGQDSVAVAESI